MKNAGAAMKQIHGGLTIDKVDATMDELREQHALGEEIASAITNAPLGEPVDETELEEELEGMEQEAMDERMLKSGSVPVGGEVTRLPSVGNGPSKCAPIGYYQTNFNMGYSTRQSSGRGRRRGRAAEAASRNGHVVTYGHLNHRVYSLKCRALHRICSFLGHSKTSLCQFLSVLLHLYLAMRGRSRLGDSMEYRWDDNRNDTSEHVNRCSNGSGFISITFS